MDISSAGKVLIAVGIAAVALGLLFVVGGSLGLGRLPGDVAFKKGNVRVYAPIATCLVLSLVVTLLFSLFSRR